MILGMTVITVSILVNQITKDTFKKNNPNLDVVIGAKGSPLQLILSSIHHIDIPTGNINYKNAKKIMKHPAIKFGVPISLGDNFQNFRIVGTNKSFFKLYNAKLKLGSIWDKPMQSVIGSNVANFTHLKIDKFFVGSHGLVDTGDVHSEQPYRVVGILKKTGTILDNLIITNLDSVWSLHSNEDLSLKNNDNLEVTALLLKYKNKTSAFSFPRLINKNTNMQAASPNLEISKLFKITGEAHKVIDYLSILIISLSFIGKKFFQLIDELFKKIPILRTIYSAIGQMTETFTSKKNNKRSVVLVEYPRKGTWAVGFATKENTGEIKKKINKKLINVFVPTTPNPTSGFLLMYPKD